ncbi:MAG: hypothetical protein JOY79_09010 [Acidobacteriaceae bacterium]|nr:hypothetical protein [Acidobacteriaceae bacterium]
MNFVDDKEPFVVKPVVSPASTPAVYFRPGEVVALSGIYRAHHQGHRFSHEVTLVAGDQQFPPCSKCKDAVKFELLRAAPNITRESGFRITLYQLSHPEETDQAA